MQRRRLSKRERERGSARRGQSIGHLSPAAHPILALAFPLILLTALPAEAQRVRAYVPADSVSIGERFQVALVAEHGIMSEAVFPDSADGVFGDLEVLERTVHERRFGGQAQPGLRIDSATYVVTTFALDTAHVPPIPVRLVAGGDTAVAHAPAEMIFVRRMVPDDAAGLRALTPLAEFPRPLWPWILAGLAALALLALFGYWLWQRLRPQQKTAQPAPAPPVSAYAEARAVLDRLEKEAGREGAAAKPFYVTLTDALRRYLARRLGLRAREQTTTELLYALDERARAGRLPASAAEDLRAVLRRADLAKFADRRPSADENRDALARARAALDAIEKAQRPAPEPAPTPTS